MTIMWTDWCNTTESGVSADEARNCRDSKCRAGVALALTLWQCPSKTCFRNTPNNVDSRMTVFAPKQKKRHPKKNQSQQPNTALVVKWEPVIHLEATASSYEGAYVGGVVDVLVDLSSGKVQGCVDRICHSSFPSSNHYH